MATQPKAPAGIGNKTYATATVTTAADGLSDLIDLGGGSLKSIQMSTAWTNASITFKGAMASTSLGSIYHTTAGVELTYATTANRTISVDPALFSGCRYIQLRSGTGAAAVAQAAARTIQLCIDDNK